jgi:DNA-3-methyladenine glycosylase
MFGPAGYAYIYFTYGMHYCFNIVAERDGIPGAVLIRGADAIPGANGPARLCRALGLDRLQNGLDLTTGTEVWLERGRPRPGERIVQTTRIGIRTAAELPWRFYLAGSPGVSRRDRRAEMAADEPSPWVEPTSRRLALRVTR